MPSLTVPDIVAVLYHESMMEAGMPLFSKYEKRRKYLREACDTMSEYGVREVWATFSTGPEVWATGEGSTLYVMFTNGFWKGIIYLTPETGYGSYLLMQRAIPPNPIGGCYAG
jgi:hypothetical protein